MKTFLRTTIFFALTLIAFSAVAQNDGKGLVDRRVTLDESREEKAKSEARKALPQAKPPAIQTEKREQEMPKLPSSDGTVKVSARLDDDSITIGDQTVLRITVEGLDGRRVQLPTPEALCGRAIEALESDSDTLHDASGKTTGIEQTVTVTSFDAGVHIIEGIVVSIDGNGQRVLLAPADTLTLTVEYVADADTVKCEVKADTDYIAEPLTFWEVARWVLWALLAAVAVLVAIWIVKRRKEHKPIVVLPGAKPLPADKRALKELESLRHKELWQKGRIKKYYTDMTDIVRRFLRNMYGIAASEMTTRQTLNAFHGIADWSEESETLLRKLLQKADMVKFAKMEPESYEHDEAMQCAVDFVRKVAETHRINNPENEGGK